MSRWLGAFLLVTASLGWAQERRARIDLEHYRADVEILPRTQSLSARVEVAFTPLEDTNTVVLELNNGLSVTRAVTEKNEDLPAVRYQQDFTVKLTFPAPLPKGQATKVTISYDGRITGLENSPVEGVNFGSIQNDRAFLLYPARWLPTNGYTSDRFTAELNVTVPTGMEVLASGLSASKPAAAGKTVFSYRMEKPSFPASIAVISAPPERVNSEGYSTLLYFRGDEKAQAGVYGEETGKIVKYYGSILGLPPYGNLTLVETEEHAPNGYAAPGIVFLSPRGIGKKLNSRLLAQQVAHQWWRVLVSPVSRRHLWLDNGLSLRAGMYQRRGLPRW